MRDKPIHIRTKALKKEKEERKERGRGGEKERERERERERSLFIMRSRIVRRNNAKLNNRIRDRY